ncbi:MAG: substrate-binding domain-containing protein [Geminicoccaceae bacterium]
MLRLAVASMLAISPAIASPVYVADTSLAAPPVAGPWQSAAAEHVLPTLCQSGSGIALLPRTPTGEEIAACAPSAVGMRIGRQAVYLAVRGESGLRSLTSDQLFRALVVRGPDAPTTWKDVDADLPALPVRVLLPSEGSGLEKLFSTTILEAGCLRDPWFRTIYDPTVRHQACTAVRDDAAVARRTDIHDVADWLKGGPEAAVAIMTAAEIDRMPDDVVVLALDGVVPTFSAVASGAYGAALPVTMVLVPGAGEDRRMVLDGAQTLTGERSLGPEGALAADGMVPLPAPDRVALRAKLASLGAYR